MSPDRWKKIKELCNFALDRAADERESYLKTACGGDEILLDEVKAQLAGMEESTGINKFLSNPPDLVEILSSNLIPNKRPSAGESFGKYKIIKPIGKGGGGDVYLAQHTTWQRNFALKFLNPQFTHKQEYLNRFREEADIADSLNHKNIVRIYGFTEENGHYVLVMEYIEGETLREVLKRSKLSLNEAVKVSLQVAEGLIQAHEKEIVHRDIKPENIMIASNQNLLVKILDFGIAGVIEDIQQNQDTRDARVEGTVSYMSPEQSRGKRVDKRTDIWSLGAVLYEMLTGRPPIESQSPFDYIALVNRNTPPPLSQFTPNIPNEVQSIIDKALAIELEDRYQTVELFQSDLKKVFPDERTLDPEDSNFSWQKYLNEIFLAERTQDTSSPLSALPIESNSSEKYPFNLSAIWGLDRSSYIGIITSASGGTVYPHLCSIEKTLYETDRQRESPLNIPPRIWFNLDFSIFPNGPNGLDNISAALIDKNFPKTELLEQVNLDDLFILGFFYEIDADIFNFDFAEIFQNWCLRLFREESLRAKQLSIVASIKGSNQNRNIITTSTTLNEIRAASLPVRVEAMTLQIKAASTANSISEKRGFTNLYLTPGTYCNLWFNAVIENSRAKFFSDKSELIKYSKLIEIIRPFESNSISESQSALAWQVVKDLDQIVSATDQEIDIQLLQLTENYSPGTLHELVGAYADSDRETVRRQSLIFASRSDSLTDAWLKIGIEKLVDSPLEDFFVAGPDGPFIDNVILGLLRYYKRGEKKEKTKIIIKNIQSYLLVHSDIYSLIDFCLGDITEDEFFDKLNLQRLMFAARVGVSVGSIAIRFKNIDIDKTDLWHFLSVIQPDQETVDVFLQLECAKRAVLGLCTPTEWQEIKLDSLLLKQILACRRGRSIHFNY